MSNHEITVVTEVDMRQENATGLPTTPGKVRRQVRCTCGWWEIVRGEGRPEIQAMHDAAIKTKP